MAKSRNKDQASDAPMVDEECDAILDRRTLAISGCTKESLSGKGHNTDAIDAFVKNPHRTGIAFSGGGIRSATISLGFAEALAVQGRFYGFDMMSTVSGGGYFGSFLRSLFVSRPEDKGILTPDEGTNELFHRSRQKLADAVLLSMPDTQYFRDSKQDFLDAGVTIKNPLWWLRENGRYLAPDGFSDYGFAVVYAVRNWLMLAFSILVAFAFCFALLQIISVAWAGSTAGAYLGMIALAQGTPPVSPIFAVLQILLLVWVGIGAGYWLSVGIGDSKSDAGQPWFVVRSWRYWATLFVSAALGMWLYRSAGEWRNGEYAELWWAIIVVSATLVATSLSVLFYSGMTGAERRNVGMEYSRNDTRLLYRYTMVLLGFVALSLVDSFALYLSHYLDHQIKAVVATAATSTGIASLFAWLIAKIPGWAEGKTSKFVALSKRNAPAAGLIAGSILIFALAISADLLVYQSIWTGVAWKTGSTLNMTNAARLLGVSAILTVTIGSSLKLLNHIAFSPLYASRLRRSYLGASNVLRQKQGAGASNDITKGKIGDDLPIKHYMKADVAAPLHLINVTVNRTVGSEQHKLSIAAEDDDPLLHMSGDRFRGLIDSYDSKLALRDRKGARMVIGPYGIRAGTDWKPWDSVQTTDYPTWLGRRSEGDMETPTLGTFCGISGAAIGPAMGRHTSLGLAMALTLANVRLGHWWRQVSRAPDAFGRWRESSLQYYRYLLKEILARYSRDDGSWYLSDGGHSENTGLLSLLERQCRFVVVCDNGEDPQFRFEDLEIAVRTARTDLGIDLKVVSKAEFPPSLGGVADLFFNDNEHSWRTQVKSRRGTAFALLLKAEFIQLVAADGTFKTDRPPAWVIWLKPKQFKGLTADLLTYAELHPDFPQQSTKNQFFDEAQWESYRRLGFAMGRKLFNDKDTAADFLPVIRHEVH